MSEQGVVLTTEQRELLERVAKHLDEDVRDRWEMKHPSWKPVRKQWRADSRALRDLARTAEPAAEVAGLPQPPAPAKAAVASLSCCVCGKALAFSFMESVVYWRGAAFCVECFDAITTPGVKEQQADQTEPGVPESAADANPEGGDPNGPDCRRVRESAPSLIGNVTSGAGNATPVPEKSCKTCRDEHLADDDPVCINCVAPEWPNWHPKPAPPPAAAEGECPPHGWSSWQEWLSWLCYLTNDNPHVTSAQGAVLHVERGRLQSHLTWFAAERDRLREELAVANERAEQAYTRGPVQAARVLGLSAEDFEECDLPEAILRLDQAARRVREAEQTKLGASET